MALYCVTARGFAYVALAGVLTFCFIAYDLVYIPSTVPSTTPSSLSRSLLDTDHTQLMYHWVAPAAAVVSVEDHNTTKKNTLKAINQTRPKEKTKKIPRGIRKMFRRIEPIFRTKGVDCRACLHGDKDALERARKVAAAPRIQNSGLGDWFYLEKTGNCSKFVYDRGYIMRPLSQEEKDFPLAYSLLVYKDIEMVERLLRAIYRPQNYYCVHVDKSATDDFFRAMTAIAGCLPGVHLTQERVDVEWGMFSVLKPELICMRELWKHRNWKYYINLTGQEFPLKTNLEIVKILKAYKGANDVQGTLKHANRERWRDTRPPHDLQPYKGSVHIAVNRDFVRHILQDQKTIDLLSWTRKTEIPDETLFATMNHNPSLGIKGSYNGPNMETKPTLTRYKNWWNRRPCAWRLVRDICILTSGDLPLLGESRHLFANKFYLWKDRIAIACLEEKNFNRTRAGVLGRNELVDTHFYSNVDFVKYQIT